MLDVRVALAWSLCYSVRKFENQVMYHADPDVISKMKKAATQVAGGVPFMLGEDTTARTFRVGLFGLDKLHNPAETAKVLRCALNEALPDDSGHAYDHAAGERTG